MSATLFVIPGSHPSMAARLMLERKGVGYSRIDLVAAIHKPVLRVLGFPGTTVPALRLDGRRVQGSREIARALDEVIPRPPLLPGDPERRRAVEDAERFGDEELQPVPRRLSWWAIKREPATVGTFLEGARIGMPVPLAVRSVGPIAAIAARYTRAGDEPVRGALAALPGMIDRVDALIAQGVLGGDEPNAADYQIATSMRLLLCFDDLRPVLDGRPAGRHARALVPTFPGRVPPVFPAGWLEPIRSAPAPR